MAFASLVGQKKIPPLWKSSRPPSFEAWLHDTPFLLKMEKMKLNLRGLPQKVLFPLETTATLLWPTSFNRCFSVMAGVHFDYA